MNCVFAHACYGVILSDAEQKKLDKLLQKQREKLEDSNEEEESLSVEDILALGITDKDFLTELQAKYNSDSRAIVHYTGNEDEHFEGSAVPAETWILGYGVLAFPGCRVPAAFRKVAEWLFWVTGEV